MVVIRLARGGAKKRPFYRIVVADQRKSRDGRFIERVGHYNPVKKGEKDSLRLEQERIAYWVANGAQPSERVSYLMKQFVKMQETQPVAAVTEKETTKETAETEAETGN